MNTLMQTGLTVVLATALCAVLSGAVDENFIKERKCIEAHTTKDLSFEWVSCSYIYLHILYTI